jgi:hypothetical protein
MKRVEIKQETSTVVYEAFDGTQFDIEEECKKYEASAYGVLKRRVMEMALPNPETDFEYLMGDDREYLMVHIKDEATLLTVNSFIELNNRDRSALIPASDIGKVIVLVVNFGGDWVWRIDLSQYSENIQNDIKHATEL